MTSPWLILIHLILLVLNIVLKWIFLLHGKSACLLIKHQYLFIYLVKNLAHWLKNNSYNIEYQVSKKSDLTFINCRESKVKVSLKFINFR